MAQKIKARRRRGENREEAPEHNNWFAGLADETKKTILATAAFLAAVLLVLSYIGKGGVAGQAIYRLLDILLGSGYFFAPIVFLLMGFSFLFGSSRKLVTPTLIGGVLFLASSLGILGLLFEFETGGAIGSAVGWPLFKLFDFWAGLVVAIGLFAISILLVFDVPLWWKWLRERDTEEEAVSARAQSDLNLSAAATDVAAQPAGDAPILPRPAPLPQPAGESAERRAHSPAANDNNEELLIALKHSVLRRFRYKKPALELLQGDRGAPSSGDIRANANIIKRTLENFGIIVEMGEVSVGPTVTQYTLRPAEGVKLSKIVALHSNLSLALAAHPIRIEAPIPGKSLVGIEVPNRSIALVGLRALLEHSAFQESPHPLLIALGRDVAGAPVYADLARMPHLLISGATGSGKSVAIHGLLSSLIYRNGPEMLRFILVDPKRVELSVYNDIPHLLTPVITDPKKTIRALGWATKEMDRRYDLLSSTSTRDITGYNAAYSKHSELEFLPYIVIIIDELADLMAMFPREVEGSIIRLAQMARAVGIHLIVATQRPSVEVITGLIKANITSRIAFQVASQVDSRTILDGAGAERLLGNGDMLFLAGDTAKPRRIQGAYVSEQEVKRVVEFLCDVSPAPEYLEEADIFSAKAGDETGDRDEAWGDSDLLLEEARALVVDAGKASASYLQRRLRVGYARAARLLDVLEARGVVGPAEGAKPREVLIKSGNSSGPEVLEG